MNYKTLQVDKETHYKVKLQAFKEDISIKELLKSMINDRCKKKK